MFNKESNFAKNVFFSTLLLIGKFLKRGIYHFLKYNLKTLSLQRFRHSSFLALKQHLFNIQTHRSCFVIIDVHSGHSARIAVY